MPLHHAATARANGRSRAKEKLRQSDAGWDGGAVSPSPTFAAGFTESPTDPRRSTKMSSCSMDWGGSIGIEDRPAAPPAQPETLVDDWRFQYFIFGAITLNAIQMGLQVDLKGQPYDTVWEVLANVFTAIFAIEMLTKLYILRCGYFKDRWNWLDFIIAWMGILDTWILPFFITEDAGLLPFQTLRLVRMVKLLRMRPELMALINGLIGSLKSMCWISILLGLVIYTFGIFCTQIIGSANYSSTSFNNDQYFGGLTRSMLTLFGICVVDSWGAVVFGIWEVQPFLVPFFIIFLVITSFGLLNALIGVIVEQTTLATQAMQQAGEDEERNKKMGLIKTLVQMVMDIDSDHDGCISAEEMIAAEEVPALGEVVKRIDLPPGFRLIDLHTMLDQDGSGQLDKDEFIGGMYRLIFCNQFHRQCLDYLSLAQTRKAIKQAQEATKQEIEMAVALLREDFERMMQKAVGGGSGATDPADVKLFDFPTSRTSGSIFATNTECPDVSEDGEDVDAIKIPSDAAGGLDGSFGGAKDSPSQRASKVRQAKRQAAAKVVQLDAARSGKPRSPPRPSGRGQEVVTTFSVVADDQPPPSPVHQVRFAVSRASQASAQPLGEPESNGGEPTSVQPTGDAGSAGSGGTRGQQDGPALRQGQQGEQTVQPQPGAAQAQPSAASDGVASSGERPEPTAAKGPSASRQGGAGAGLGASSAGAYDGGPDQTTLLDVPQAKGKKRWNSVMGDAPPLEPWESRAAPEGQGIAPRSDEGRGAASAGPSPPPKDGASASGKQSAQSRDASLSDTDSEGQ